MTTYARRCVEESPAIVPAHHIAKVKDIMPRTHPKRSIPILMTTLEINGIRTQDIIIQRAIKRGPVPTIISTKRMAMQRRTTGTLKISIANEGISRRSLDLAVTQASTTAIHLEIVINGVPMTITIVSTESMSKNSTDNRKNTSGHRKRQMRELGKGILAEMRMPRRL
jgi:hypothetical protein